MEKSLSLTEDTKLESDGFDNKAILTKVIVTMNDKIDMPQEALKELIKCIDQPSTASQPLVH